MAKVQNDKEILPKVSTAGVQCRNVTDDNRFASCSHIRVETEYTRTHVSHHVVQHESVSGAAKTNSL